MQQIKIIDLFAGPGGLGEGFSAFQVDGVTPFRIALSVEKDKYAHKTLRLRAFWRLLKQKRESMSDLYAYYRGERSTPEGEGNKYLWDLAGEEAIRFELGEDNDEILYSKISKEINPGSMWVLVGGPPCQAYSVMGRVRQGRENDNDPRHKLYKEYIKVINKFRPAIFVMENVQGLLSSKPHGEPIIYSILNDLSCMLGNNTGPVYSIHSLVSDACYVAGSDNVESIDLKKYIVRCENYGVPQARHRLILIGIRSDIKNEIPKLIKSAPYSVRDVIGSLPPLRSGISKGYDSGVIWKKNVRAIYDDLKKKAFAKGHIPLANLMGKIENKIGNINHMRGGRWVKATGSLYNSESSPLFKWLEDDTLDGWLNHYTRSHMVSDLCRYAYVSCFAQINGKNPVGQKDFDLPGLAPNHANWNSGNFVDRFKTQIFDRPSSTITSHISKDGHAYIHPDPCQCRSLTVREAARLQTFPDNYFFEGPRTCQYIQVGNAVPPFLALQIAECVWSILHGNN